MKKEMVIVKFGGSLITDKSSDKPKINRLHLEAIGKILNQKNYDLIVVHGAGSFGHPIAKKFGIATGLDGSHGQEKAIKETREQVQELNNILCNYMNAEGISTASIAPSSTMTTNGPKEIIDFPFELFDRALKENKIPITFGDVTQDEKQGISILSGDILMMELTKYYEPLYSIFVMDHPGVYDGDPNNPDSKIKSIINIETIKNLNSNQKGADVTGGLVGKIECAVEMANYSETWITNLDLLKGFFDKKPLGSKVVL